MSCEKYVRKNADDGGIDDVGDNKNVDDDGDVGIM